MLPITCHWQSRFREIRWWGNFKRSSCRCDTLVFSGSQTCGILLFRTRAESSFGEQKVKDSDRLELDWSWADLYVSLCECACCGLKRIPIQPRIEQNIFMLFAAAERDDTHSKKPSPLQFAARIQM